MTLNIKLFGGRLGKMMMEGCITYIFTKSRHLYTTNGTALFFYARIYTLFQKHPKPQFYHYF
jgi:hypothetical protein